MKGRAPHLHQLSPLAPNESSYMFYGHGMPRGELHWAVCLSVCPASGQRALKGCDPPGGSTRCCEEHCGKEQKGGGAAFKVFVRSDICTAKCDIVAKVTACFLFGKSKGIPNIDRLPAFALFNLHNFLSFGRNFSGLPLETMFFHSQYFTAQLEKLILLPVFKKMLK